MSRLFIQLSKGEIASCLERGRGEPLAAGPVIRLKTPLTAADPTAWVQALQPLHAFLVAVNCRPTDVILVPTEVRLEVLHLPRIPKMSPREILEAHSRLHGGTEHGAEEVHWRVLPPLPGATAETVSFVTVSLDAALSRRLREVPIALGCPRAIARLLPYPIAAAAAAAHWVPGGSIGLLDVADRETALVVAWQGVPISYYRSDFGADAIVGALCTKLAVGVDQVWALTPDKARETLADLNLGTMYARIAEESIPQIRQILQALDIALQRFRDDLGGAVDQVRDTFEVAPAAFAVWSACPLVGLGDYVQNRIPHASWASFDLAHPPPALAVTADAARAAAVPLVVVAGADALPSASSPWEEISEKREREERVFVVSQRIMGCIGALVLGLAIGHGTNVWLVGRALAVQSSLDKLDEPASRGPARLATARKETASTLQLLQAMGTEDLAVRSFLADLGRYKYPALALDLFEVSVPPAVGGEGGSVAPVVQVNGRAASAEQDLQEFLRFLTALPTVRDAVLENVEKSAAEAADRLPCSFRIRVRLKGKP